METTKAVKVVNCPLCGVEMKVADAPYGDGEILPTGTCPQCGLQTPVINLNDPDTAERFARCHLRQQAEKAVEGFKATKALRQACLTKPEVVDILRSVVQNPTPHPFASAGPAESDLPAMEPPDINLLLNNLLHDIACHLPR